MSFTTDYAHTEPTRDEIERLPGKVLLEFGTGWCGYCQAIQSDLANLLADHPEIRHVKVEDGKGRPLGRSFRVKLWPTLVFLDKGKIVSQMARPDREQMRNGLAALLAASTED